MRITKVKVKEEKVLGDNLVLKLPEKMVLIHRKADKGTLILDNAKTKGQNHTDKTDTVIDDCKNDSFKLSLIKKTIEDKSNFKDKQDKLHTYIKKVIDTIISNEIYCSSNKIPLITANDKEVTVEKLSSHLKHKFRKDITFYKDKDKKVGITFNLVTDLREFIISKDESKLDNYKQWVHCHLNSKKNFTKKSINNNRLVVNYSEESSLSKRKKVLMKWADELNKDNNSYLSEYQEKLFGVGTSFDNRYSQCLSSVGKDGKQRTDDDILKSLNYDLKKALQARQSELFGKKVLNDDVREHNRSDDKLYVYFTEAVKYFEHYFPIKKKIRKKVLTMDDVKHYLDETTIKETIANQIENAVRLQLLQQGKSQFHKYDNDTNSSTLAKNKRDEFFVLNLVEACAFASNNIRNIVDETQVSDILVKEDLTRSINKGKFDSELFNQFYKNNASGTFLNEDDSQKPEQTIWALRGSAQMIRNMIIHFKKDAIDKIFSIDDFEYLDNGDKYYTQTIFKNALAYDIDNLPQVFVEQLSSNDVLRYYNSEDIVSFLNSCKFSLCRSSIPFAPGFKTIYEKGFNLQNDRDSFLLKYYHLDQYGDGTKTAKAYSAFRFLLMLLYNNCFLPRFLDEKNGKLDFEKAVTFTLDDNRDNKQTSKEHEYAFKDIPYLSGLSIAAYMSNIHSLDIQEKNKKEKNKEDKNKEEKDNRDTNTQKFIKQVFIKGFDNFLRKLKLEFLLSPTNIEKDSAADDEYAKLCKDVNVGHTIDKDSNSHIAFYTFCKLLDAVHLSDLRNELIKYKSSDIDGSFDLEYVINIIELCLLNVDRVDNIVADSVKTKWKKGLDSFVDKDIKTDSELYIQSDNYTPVVHASIATMCKYGTFPILQKLVEKAQVGKITKKDYEDWKEFNATSPVDKVSKIEGLMKEREELHKQWVEVKNGKKKNDGSIDKKRYLDACNEIEKYNWLDNKLHLVHLKRLHNLTIQILSRLARFVALWDRDFIMFDGSITDRKYKLLGFVNFVKLDKNIDCSLQDFTKFIFIDSIVKVDDKSITVEDLEELKKELETKRKKYFELFFKKNKKVIDHRNEIAHYNYISKFEKNDYSLLNLMANLRDLMQYDRKLRNAVTKSLINVFEQNGMILELEVSHDQKEEIKVKSVVPKTISHLDDKKLTTPLVSEDYCNLCKALLEMKK